MLIRQRGGEKWIKKQKRGKKKKGRKRLIGPLLVLPLRGGGKPNEVRREISSWSPPARSRGRLDFLYLLKCLLTASHPSRSLHSNPSLICKPRYCSGRLILLGKTHTCSVSTDSEVGKGSGISSRLDFLNTPHSQLHHSSSQAFLLTGSHSSVAQAPQGTDYNPSHLLIAHVRVTEPPN